MEEWENLARQYASGRQDEAIQTGHRKLQRADESDWRWLADALKDQIEKWFVAAIFRGYPVPKRLVETMLRAAIHEVDPDSNRQFILPCVESFGHRKVNEFLLNVVEGDDDVEIAGAVAALYWANMKIQYTGNVPQYTLEYATPESRKDFMASNDVWVRKRETFLRVFVNNYNVSIRQQIIPSLNLDESAYPDELKPLVQRAIEIARNHSDEYIRHRVEVQLGNERLIRPIPNRPTSATD